VWGGRLWRASVLRGVGADMPGDIAGRGLHVLRHAVQLDMRAASAAYACGGWLPTTLPGSLLAVFEGLAWWPAPHRSLWLAQAHVSLCMRGLPGGRHSVLFGRLLLTPLCLAACCCRPSWMWRAVGTSRAASTTLCCSSASQTWAALTRCTSTGEAGRSCCRAGGSMDLRVIRY